MCENIVLIGAPAKLMLDYIKPLYPQAKTFILEDLNPQCTNAMLLNQKHRELIIEEFHENDY